MNGNRYLLDTNCIIEILQNNNLNLLHKLNNAEYVCVSVISKIEFLAFPKITKNDKVLFYNFLNIVDIIDLKSCDDTLIDTIINLRQEFKLKLPDAIIVATAKVFGSTLLTRDKELLKLSLNYVDSF